MKKKRWICIIILVALILLIVIGLIVRNFFYHSFKKVEGSIPHNESCVYLPSDSRGLLEISKDATVTEYKILSNDENRKSIQKTGSFHVEMPVKKYISSELFITENDDIMFGDIRGTEYKKLGTVKNASDISIVKNYEKMITHAAVATSDGLLYVQGDNSTGALGIEEKQVNDEFVQVPNLQNVIKAVCGINCILVLNADGEVFMSGTLAGGLSYQTFTKLEVPEKIKDIAASDVARTLIALGVDGNIYELGKPSFGEYYIAGVYGELDETVYSSFHKISKLENIVSIITIDEMEACAVDENGKVFYWGTYFGSEGKLSLLKKFFVDGIYGLPEYDEIWYQGYFYVLSNNEITAYYCNYL